MSWKGPKGRVTLYLKEIIKSSNGKDVYICGPPGMKDAVEEILLKDLNFKKEQIYFEKW